MFKYAEIYGGKVRDLRESHLGYVEFCSIFNPSSYWLDVTGVEDIQIGYIAKFSPELGTHFELPEPLQEEITLETVKLGKLEVLKSRFLTTIDTAFIISSLGFRANAGQRAKSDVDGLITSMEEENIEIKGFRDYDNIIHELSLDEIKTLRLEIIKNGEYIYYQKWEYENTINSCETIEDLEQLNLDYKMMDFVNNEPF